MAIHDNPELSNVDKFNYLKSLLGAGVIEAIAGLEDNYGSAIEILKKRFGNRQQIISKHMEQLFQVEAVTSPYDLKGLRHLYDVVEANKHSLKALGVNSESYGALLSSVLMTKLPNELRLIVSRQAGEGEWNFDAIWRQWRQRCELGSAPSHGVVRVEGQENKSPLRPS